MEKVDAWCMQLHSAAAAANQASDDKQQCSSCHDGHMTSLAWQGSVVQKVHGTQFKNCMSQTSGTAASWSTGADPGIINYETDKFCFVQTTILDNVHTWPMQGIALLDASSQQLVFIGWSLGRQN